MLRIQNRSEHKMLFNVHMHITLSMNMKTLCFSMKRGHSSVEFV
jgi:hypothetical protein